MAVPYSEAAQRYTNPEFQGRAQACCAEQAAIFINDARPEFNLLASGVLAGNLADIDAIIRQVTVIDTVGDIDTEDAALLSAVQSVWPIVGAARYGSGVV